MQKREFTNFDIWVMFLLGYIIMGIFFVYAQVGLPKELRNGVSVKINDLDNNIDLVSGLMMDGFKMLKSEEGILKERIRLLEDKVDMHSEIEMFRVIHSL